MTIETSKLTAYVATGDSVTVGVFCAKLTAYILMEPGAEVGATPNTNQGYTYAQVLDQED